MAGGAITVSVKLVFESCARRHTSHETARNRFCPALLAERVQPSLYHAMIETLVDHSEGSMDRNSDDAVIRALRGLIAEGGYALGTCMARECALTDGLGLTRAALPKTPDSLERDGLVWRHVGKGAFVAKGDGAALDQIPRHPTLVRMRPARPAIEPASARETPGGRRYEARNGAFHDALARVSDNLLPVALSDRRNQAQRAVAPGAEMRGTDRSPADRSSRAGHADIVATTAVRDPVAGQDATRTRLTSVSARL